MSASVVFAARDAGPVLAGAPNFRDLGGLPAAGDQRVCHGRVYRSGHLGDLASEDVRLLERALEKGACVLDLRGAAERERSVACALPGAVVHSLPIEPTVAARLQAHQAAGQALTEAVALRFMEDAYCGFVRNARAQLAAFFGHLLEAGERPVVLHCAAGKDRTGFVAAMLLCALEVPRAAVLEDYLLTNARVAPREDERFPPTIARILTTVQAPFLQAAFAAIDEEFGNPQRFLQTAVGLQEQQVQRLRALLLERARSA